MAKTEKKEYVAPDGTVYKSYEEYVNSPDLDLDLVQLKLYQRQRKPQNDSEERLLSEIKKAEKEGKYLELYPE